MVFYGRRRFIPPLKGMGFLAANLVTSQTPSVPHRVARMRRGQSLRNAMRAADLMWALRWTGVWCVE
jgi:hypothetical protein